METVTNQVTTRELRGQLSDVLGRAMYAGERIGVTRHGKLAAVVIGVADLKRLRHLKWRRTLQPIVTRKPPTMACASA